MKQAVTLLLLAALLALGGCTSYGVGKVMPVTRLESRNTAVERPPIMLAAYEGSKKKEAKKELRLIQQAFGRDTRVVKNDALPSNMKLVVNVNYHGSYENALFYFLTIGVGPAWGNRYYRVESKLYVDEQLDYQSTYYFDVKNALTCYSPIALFMNPSTSEAGEYRKGFARVADAIVQDINNRYFLNNYQTLDI